METPWRIAYIGRVELYTSAMLQARVVPALRNTVATLRIAEFYCIYHANNKHGLAYPMRYIASQRLGELPIVNWHPGSLVRIAQTATGDRLAITNPQSQRWIEIPPEQVFRIGRGLHRFNIPHYAQRDATAIHNWPIQGRT